MKMLAFLIGLLLFAGTIAAGTLFMAGFTENYNLAYDNPTLYNKTSEIMLIANDMQNETQNSEIQASNIFVTASQGSYTALKLTNSGLGILSGFLVEFSSVTGLPPFVLGIITTIFVLLVVFAWIAFANRWEA